MSIEVTTAVWRRSASVLADRLVMLYIADRCNDDGGGAYPSVSTIAENAGISERGVQLSIKRLVEMGELTVQFGAGPRGTNVYKINLDSLGLNPSPKHGIPRKDCTPEKISPRIFRQGPPKTFRKTPEKISPNTSVKPSMEPSVPDVVPTSGRANRSKPLPEHGPAQQIVAAYCREAEIEKPASYAREVGIAQKLSDAGLVPGEVPSLYDHCRVWARDGVDLRLMLDQYNKWRSSQRQLAAKKERPLF